MLKPLTHPNSYFQAEAIHPDCAIIAQHLRAREICSETRRSEARNQTDHRGGCIFSNAAAHAAAAAVGLLCFCAQTHTRREELRSNLGALREVFNRQECGLNYKKRSLE